uniref:HTH_38 domain-containing protein n=1 Tax=Heterorhabditis bacteriophora TaxID=37862 RepID=A0A1I7W6G6_HETBA
MSRDPKLNQDEKDQIKALSTAGYTLKQISDVVKRSKKATIYSLSNKIMSSFTGYNAAKRLKSSDVDIVD